jgi:hypothetical protein
VDKSRRHGRRTLDSFGLKHQTIGVRTVGAVDVLLANMYQSRRKIGLLYPVMEGGRYITVALSESCQRHAGATCGVRWLWRMQHQPQAARDDWIERQAKGML